MRDATLSVRFALLLLFTTCTQAISYPPFLPVDPPVSSLCAVVDCFPGRRSTCRVVQSCAGPGCPPQAACVSCVPRGVDDVCNSYRYIYAVLVGDFNSPDKLSPRSCNPRQPGGPPNCPNGSVCVPDRSTGRGQCCFGKPDPLPHSGIVSNEDPICGVGPCGVCKPGYVCKKQPIVCVTYPCDPIYTCVKSKKDDACPLQPLYPPPWCFLLRQMRPVDRCRQDYDCPRTLKCCSDECGFRACTGRIDDD